MRLERLALSGSGWGPGAQLRQAARRAARSELVIAADVLEEGSSIARRVPRSLHVRLDDASADALEVVRAGEMTDSEAVRTALREAVARRRVRSALREEVRRLAADEGDREEMRIVREQLAELAPRRLD